MSNDNDTVVKLEVRRPFGRVLVYPACKKSLIFAKIAGTVTLTKYTLRRIEELGYTLDVVGEPAPMDSAGDIDYSRME